MDNELATYIGRGGDSVAKFLVYSDDVCPCCNKEHQVVIIYQDTPFKGEDWVRKAPSLIIRDKKRNGTHRKIGVSCGCYAKLHRQITHIRNGKAKKNGKG